MSRVVLNSANTAVLIGDSPAFKTDNETGTLFAGVQSASFSIPQTRQTQKQVGSCYYSVDDLVRHPDVDLEISYLFSPSMVNESAMGLNIYDSLLPQITAPSNIKSSFVSGVDDKSYNFYFYNHPKQNFNAIKYLTSSSINTPNNGEIISFGNAYLMSYGLSFSDGELPTVSTQFKCSNMQAEGYSGDVVSPAINLLSGNNSSVGKLDVSETITDKLNFYGQSDLDLTDPILSQPGDLVLELQNLQVGGQLISGGNHIVKTLSVEIPINRVDLHGLGSDYVRGRKMQYPSRGNLTMSSLVSKYETGFISGLLNDESEYDFTIKAKSCDGKADCEMKFGKLKLETFNYGIVVNEEMQYSASFSFSMDNKSHIGDSEARMTVNVEREDDLNTYAFDSSGDLLSYDQGDVDVNWMQNNPNIKSMRLSKADDLTIGMNAFNNCGLSGGIYIPGNVTTIGLGAFYFCKSLNGGLVIEEGVEIIEPYALGNCDGFNGTLRLPSTITSIGNFAFERDEFSRVEIHATTAPTIASFAFVNMPSVEDSKIHVPVGAVGYAASYDGLTVVYDL